LGPTFTMIFTNVTLAKSMSIVEAITSTCSFIGAASAAQPSNPVDDLANDADYVELHFLGVACALLGAVTSATAFTTVRRLHTSTHFSFSVFFVGAAAIVLTTVAMRGAVLSAICLATRKPSAAVLLIMHTDC
jgi:drug/metabolite transporter (DMT)-like permease